MLKSIKLQNYRTHKDTYIEFDKLNSIVGENHSGKTNVFRALLTALSLRDFTESDITYGEKSGSIHLVFDDGRQLTRARDGKNQSIKLVSPNGEEKEYFTVKDTRSIVEDFTGIKPVRLDGNKDSEFLQIFRSDESQSWIFSGYSPASILQRVNRLVFDNVIELAKKNIDQTSRGQLSELDVAKAEASRVVDELCGFDSVEELQRLLSAYNDCKEQEANCIEKVGKTKRLIDLRNTLEEAEATFSRIETATDRLTNYDNTLCNIRNTMAAIARVTYLQNQITDIETQLANIDETQEVCPTCQRPL